jgi:hypothetical protein
MAITASQQAIDAAIASAIEGRALRMRRFYPSARRRRAGGSPRA